MIFHLISCLFFLRMLSRLSSCEALHKEDMTTGHCSCCSKYTYLNSVGKGLRTRFCGSPVPSSVSIGRISYFFLQCPCTIFMSWVSCYSSGQSTSSSVNTSCICCWTTRSSRIVSIMQTSSWTSSTGCMCF